MDLKLQGEMAAPVEGFSEHIKKPANQEQINCGDGKPFSTRGYFDKPNPETPGTFLAATLVLNYVVKDDGKYCIEHAWIEAHQRVYGA